MDVSFIMSKFGGAAPLADLLGYPVTTVRNWEDRKRIPAKHFATLIDAAKKKGVSLTAEELVSITKTKKSKHRSN